jgi:hypothetical protein
MIERFSASVASKHLACHASANLELAIPGWVPPPNQGSTAASEKGEAMHHILELAGSYAPKEMEGIAEAMAYVAKLRQQRRFKTLLEEATTGWWLQQKPNTRADVVLHVQDEIHVIDYKFGRIPVSADENVQGMYYSAAYLPLAPKATGATFHVVQPLVKAGISSAFFSREKLEQFMVDTRKAEEKILARDITFTPGDHCTFCPANSASRGARGNKVCPEILKLYHPHRLTDDDIMDALGE